ncbi:ODV-E66 [Spodoptera litura nucleopolyhedrovirus II]|uniref:ODV-E66 n=1 Tax=Spodoptera litura nucleopolyhedrovirus II TaxID=566270 RepID=UPI0001874613|nr:ODV-E66 [Spodoptera litura nucleopolyhedrovirus II]ACI47487.1 ODV-E66 [Spodoptera litura nucleopolyhedrovirus II]
MVAVWLLVVVIVIIVIVLYFNQTNNNNNSTKNTNQNSNGADEIDPFDAPVDLYSFEKFYRSTVWQTRKLRTDFNDDDIAYKFVDDNQHIIETLDPFENAKDFAQLLRTLNAYAMYICVDDGNDNRYSDVAVHLFRALTVVASKLPMPAPYQQLPWGFDEMYWNVFSICLTECAMLLSIALRPYIDVTEIAVKIIDNYVAEPNFSMGWRRNTGYATRMCVPYIYAQLCKGVEIADIASQPSVAGVLDEVRHHGYAEGSGIRTDFINYVDSNVRNYSFMVENYFTFQYYNFLFGRDFVSLSNVHNSLDVVGSNSGRVHPALLYKNGVHVAPVIAEIMRYDRGVFTADFSKVVTVRNDNYFASLVSPVNGVAYYQANYDFRNHALLWTMTKRIWPNDNGGGDDDSLSLIDAGAIIIDDSIQKLPQNDVLLSPNTSMSFLPNPAFTAIASVDDSAAAIASFSKFDALNIEYYSYTLYHPSGMLQLYDNVKTLTRIDRDAYCVVLMLKESSPPPDYDDNDKVVVPHEYDVYKDSQGCEVKHHNIENYKQLPDFKVKSLDNYTFVCQPIPAQDINDGEGTVCYSMTTVAIPATTTQIIKGNKLKRNFKVIVGEDIECVFEFPYVLLKNNATRCLTINNAYQTTKHLHNMYHEDIQHLLEQVGLGVDDLLSDIIKRTPYAFTFENSLGNQFKFYY